MGVNRMVNVLRTSLIAAAVVAFAGFAFAEPAPPAPAQPEVKSPCIFEIDAAWLVPLKSTSAKTVRTKVQKPVNCEGAVITAVSATGKDSVTTLDFTVTYKPGHDRAGFISYAIIDENNRPMGVGETQDTLVAGTASHVTGTFKLKSRDFDRIFESGKNPVMRIEFRMGREEPPG
jgi:hypothetical protein